MPDYCDNNKEIFPRRSDGLDRIINLRRKGRHTYALYKCDVCGGFHITTTTKKRVGKTEVEKFEIEESLLPKKKKYVPNPPHVPKNSVPKQTITTGRFMTKETADALKRLINANSHEQKNP